MFKKAVILLFSAALTAVLMLAAGGIFILPENMMLAYMYADVWNAVGGLFSLMLVPGFAVGFAACQSRILGVIYFVGFIVLGFISGISPWWLITAVLLILSYIFFISENVGYYDELDTFDRFCVGIPAFGAMRFIDRLGLEGLLGVIGKLLSAVAVGLNFVLLFAMWVVPKDNASAFGVFVSQIKSFGGTLFGAAVIFVFLPLFSVYSARYSFIKPGLAKVLTCFFGGYDIMRGAFVTMPILMNTAGGGTVDVPEATSPIFNDMFGIEACLLMAMVFGGILCFRAAFGKKLGTVARFCLTTDGTSSLRCLMMAVLTAVLVFSIAPAAVFVIWLVVGFLFLLLFVAAIKNVPGYSYNDLRSMGYSDYEANKLLRIANGNMNGI